jgi:hypothetical protein
MDTTGRNTEVFRIPLSVRFPYHETIIPASFDDTNMSHISDQSTWSRGTPLEEEDVTSGGVLYDLIHRGTLPSLSDKVYRYYAD